MEHFAHPASRRGILSTHSDGRCVSIPPATAFPGFSNRVTSIHLFFWSIHINGLRVDCELAHMPALLASWPSSTCDYGRNHESNQSIFGQSHATLWCARYDRDVGGVGPNAHQSRKPGAEHRFQQRTGDTAGKNRIVTSGNLSRGRPLFQSHGAGGTESVCLRCDKHMGPDRLRFRTCRSRFERSRCEDWPERDDRSCGTNWNGGWNNRYAGADQ